MKKVIARKNRGAGRLYIVLTLLGAVLLVFGWITEVVPLCIAGAALCICIFLVIPYLRLPAEIILLDEDGNVVLPKGVLLKTSELTDISYLQARGKGVVYKWGSVTVKTATDTYKFGFVSDCEQVAKQLMALKYTGNLSDV